MAMMGGRHELDAHVLDRRTFFRRHIRASGENRFFVAKHF